MLCGHCGAKSDEEQRERADHALAAIDDHIEDLDARGTVVSLCCILEKHLRTFGGTGEIGEAASALLERLLDESLATVREDARPTAPSLKIFG